MRSYCFYLFLFLSLSVQAMTLTDLENRARERNPELREARQSWKVLDAQKGPAGAWPDPTFTFISERFPSGMDGVSAEPIRHYRVEQPIPFPGKLSQEAQMKHHEAIIAETKYRALELEILGQVREKAYQLALTDQSIELANQSVAVLKSMLRTAQARLAGNQSSAADVFMTQTELRRMENLAYGQTRARVLVQIELNSLLNDPTEKPVDAIAAPPLEDMPQSLAALQTLAAEHSPWVLYGHHEKQHSQAMIARSRLDYAPDFSVMAEKEATDAGQQGRQLGISITFPLWLERPWGNVRAAQEHALETDAMAEAQANTVRRMVHTEFVERETYLTQARMIRDGIIPSAESTLNVVRQQYASGQTDFLRFLEAFRAWITARLDYENEIYQYAEHDTELKRWVGMDLDADKSCGTDVN